MSAELGAQSSVPPAQADRATSLSILSRAGHNAATSIGEARGFVTGLEVSPVS